MTTLTPQEVSPKIEGKLLAIQSVIGYLLLTVRAEHEGRVSVEMIEGLRNTAKQTVGGEVFEGFSEVMDFYEALIKVMESG